MDSIIQRYITQKGMNDKYSYIRTTNDLYNNLVNAHRDLSYPLRKEAKRDRFILNSQGLEKDIERVINETIANEIQPLIDTVSTAIVNESYGKLQAIHNGVSYKTNTSDIGSMLGKALGNAVINNLKSFSQEKRGGR